MANWLLKTEPSVYSFADLLRDKSTIWDGIKNNLALKHLNTVKKGDRCIIYHTGGERVCVGLGTATTGAYPDPEKDDPRLLVFDIKVGKALKREVSLAEMKLNPRLEGFDLFRLGRLSFVPVSDAHYDEIMEMAKGWGPHGRESMKKADFRQFYRDAHAVECLSEREKIFLGLAVAMTRNCDPWVDRRLADARKAGIAEGDLDAAVDVIAAVDAGILQSLNQRIKQRHKEREWLARVGYGVVETLSPRW